MMKDQGMKLGRTFVLGDIHGTYKALKQVLEASNFDYELDTLIQLGDVTDGYNEVYEVVEELLKIKNLITIKGNHDVEFLYWIKTGKNNWDWAQGGLGTLDSYCRNLNKEYQGIYKAQYTTLIPEDIPESHKEFFKNQIPVYIDDQNRLFVHGGFNRLNTINWHLKYDEETLYWDRDLFRQALSCAPGVKLKTIEDFKEIYLGHTTTQNWETTLPLTSGGVTNMDTGAGFKGLLSLMDIDTKEVFQSDNTKELYPDWMHGR